MIKLIAVFCTLVGASIVLGVGGLMLLPLLALLPGLLALGAGLFAGILALGICFFILRLFAVVLIGVSSLVIGGIGFIFLLASGAVALALGIAMAHLLLPLLLVAGLIWLLLRATRASPQLHDGICETVH